MTQPRRSRLALLCLVLFFAHLSTPPSFAERPPLKIYSASEGLANESVNKIVRDSRGFLWFCTAEGLSRFDGYRFKNYTQEQGLPHRNVNDFLETRDGVYLVATSVGISVFNPNGRAYRWNILESKLEQTSADAPLFQTFFPQQRTVNQSTTFLSLAQDRKGAIWAGTSNGLFQVQKIGDRWEIHEFEFEDWKGNGIGFSGLLPDSVGGIFIGSSAGVYRVSPNGDVKRLNDNAAASIFQDRDGNLWIDSALGLCVFSIQGDALRLLKTFSQKDGLPPHAIHFCTTQTSDGRIFVGFEYGLSEFLTQAKEGEPRFRILAVEKINALAEDPGGNLWVGTDSKGAWKLAHNRFSIFGEQDGLSPSDEIMSVFPDKQGGVFVASRPNKLSHLENGHFETLTPMGLTQRSWGWHYLDLLSKDDEWWIPAIDGWLRYPKIAKFGDLARTSPKRAYTSADGLFSSETFNQFEDSRGDIWICVIGSIENTLLRWERNTGRLIPYTGADGLPIRNGPLSFAEDSHGSVWFGYYFGGLTRYREGKFRLFTEQDGMPRSQVIDLLADSSGHLWIATSGRGLLRLDETNSDAPVFKSLSTANGLSSNQPICLTEDKYGRVYVGTGRGINRIDKNGNVKIFTQEDGLPSNYVTRTTADKNGNLWFVTSNTLVRLEPGPDQDSTPPAVLIDRVLVNGVPQRISELGENETKPLELESSQRQIEVDFFALSFGAGENIRYQYRLDSEDWSTPTRQQTLNLDLAPGKHSLLVRAVGTDGFTSETPAVASFTILPPIYLRPWFICLVILISGAVLYLFYRYRTSRLLEVNSALAEANRAEEALRRSREERLVELERVRERIATDLHDDIGSSLTQIAILSEVAHQQAGGDGNNGSEPITRIISVSNELVDTMSDIVWAINPKRDHLSDLLQRMRRFASDVFTARQIAFNFQAADSHRDLELGANIRREVYLIFKESVNNIVKHSGCTRADIEFRIEDDWLVLKISDNGNGFKIAPTKNDDLMEITTLGGNGILNMRRRAREMGGTFDIKSDPAEGTATTLRMRISQQPPDSL